MISSIDYDEPFLIVESQAPHVDCVLCAFASVLRVSRDEMIEALGTDGTEIILPEAPHPFDKKGILIEEIIRYGAENNLTLTPIDPHTRIESEYGDYDCGSLEEAEFVRRYMQGREGIAFGTGKTGNPHCVAWDGEEYHDPNGYKYQALDNGMFSLDFFVWITEPKWL